MTDVKRITLKQLRNAELSSFGMQIKAILLETLDREADYVRAFVEAADAYDASLGTVLPDALSLEEADAVGDRAWGALYFQLQASSRNMRDDVRAAAETVQHIFDKTPNPTTKGYAEEYGAIRALLEQLASLPTETLETAHVQEAVDQLQIAHDRFMAQWNANRAEGASREPGIRKAARNTLLEQWQKLIVKLPLLSELTGDPQIDKAIQQINFVVESTKSKLNQRK